MNDAAIKVLFSAKLRKEMKGFASVKSQVSSGVKIGYR
jgi:hypothetical protein